MKPPFLNISYYKLDLCVGSFNSFHGDGGPFRELHDPLPVAAF